VEPSYGGGLIHLGPGGLVFGVPSTREDVMTTIPSAAVVVYDPDLIDSETFRQQARESADLSACQVMCAELARRR
jgi:hypothetical protein